MPFCKGYNRTRYILLLILLVAGSVFDFPSHAKEKPLKVFVCAGQSNMVGSRGLISELPEGLQAIQKGNLFFDGESWISVEPGKTEKPYGFGPEISFAMKLSVELKEPIGIIKYGVGGSCLAEEWSPKNKHSLYANLLKKVKAAQESKKIEIVGMIWMQGERDSKDQKKARAYSVNLTNFVKAARKDFDSPNMLFVAGRVNPPKEKFPYVDEVRKAQVELKTANYAFIDCDSLKKIPDNVHYATEGLVDMGNKFADAILKLMKR